MPVFAPEAAPEIIVDCFRHGHSMMQAAMEDPDTPAFIGGRQDEVELSPRGEEEAEALGRYLGRQGLRPTRVYCSTAKRAIRTFEIATAGMGLCMEPIIDPRLAELDQGEWTNQRRTLYDEPDVNAEMERLGSSFAPPGGESMDTVDARLADFFASQRRTNTNPEQPDLVWVFGHGVATKTRVGKLLGWSHEQTYKATIGNVSDTRLVRENGVWRPVFVNRRTV